MRDDKRAETAATGAGIGVATMALGVPVVAAALAIMVTLTAVAADRAPMSAAAVAAKAPIEQVLSDAAVARSPTADASATEAAASAQSAAIPDPFGVAPKTPWLPLPASDAVLTKLIVGSCLSQTHPQPIWDAILAEQPSADVMLMIGDNVYGDVSSAAMTELVAAYKRQAELPIFGQVRAMMPFLATWDDHDYGRNDAGAAFEFKAQAETLFRAYWQQPFAARPGGGVYQSRTFGPAGQRVQIILLDTRTHRSDLKKRGDEAHPTWGRYAPDMAADKTMLGDAQWQWLETQLRAPADLRLVVSSIQVHSDGHGFESWAMLPRERDRLRQLVLDTGATGVVLLSGDRHMGALYAKRYGANVLPEMTASSLNRSYGPSKDAKGAALMSDLHHVENYGVVDINWSAQTVTLALRGLGGAPLDAMTVRFADMGITGKPEGQRPN